MQAKSESASVKTIIFESGVFVACVMVALAVLSMI